MLEAAEVAACVLELVIEYETSDAARCHRKPAVQLQMFPSDRISVFNVS